MSPALAARKEAIIGFGDAAIAENQEEAHQINGYAFWCTLRRKGFHWWISYFKDFPDVTIFDGTKNLHIEWIRYCLMNLIQTELDKISNNWNMHVIRRQKNIYISCGKPDVMYFVPETLGT